MICIAVIIYATWFPHPLPDNSLPGIPHIDKLFHAIMFGGLTGALMFDYYRSAPAWGRLGLRTVVAFCCAVAAFGAVDEVVQGWLANSRMSEGLDFAADIVGILVASLTAPPLIRVIISGRRPRRLSERRPEGRG